MKISEYQYILCSSFARVKDILVEQDILHPAPIQIGVITNAADVDKEENVPLWWIDEDISALEDLGYHIQHIDLKQENLESLSQKGQQLDAIFVSGGNTFYLLDCMRKSGFDQYIYNFLHHGGIYLSTSAGSCVCAPDIEYAKYSDDSSIVELATYQGLHFCNLAINPHFGGATTEEEVSLILKYFATNNVKFPCLNLSDQQAIAGNLDGMFKVIA